MKCGLAIIVVLVTLFSSYCNAETSSVNASSSKYPGQCLYEFRIYRAGEHKLPGCTRLICSQKGWASVHSCIDSFKEGCIRGEAIDIKKPFPECCKREYTCQHTDGTEYTITDY